MQRDARLWQVGLVGYGEVGRILAEDLRRQGVGVAAYDRKLELGGSGDAAVMREHAARHGVALAGGHGELSAAADLVVSAVTASQAVPVAQVCAPALRAGTWYLDMNSASPCAKQQAARLVDGAGGRFVEAAVMTSVPPHRIRVPILLGGAQAAALAPALERLGFSAHVASERLGVASATKMCRSVIIKGMEAMFFESLVAARAYGVEEQVLASLQETFPGIDWDRQASYFFQRSILHGRRRAEEMFEAAATVREIGLEPWSADGTARRQAWIADCAGQGIFGAAGPQPAEGSWRDAADRILASRGRTAPAAGAGAKESKETI